MSKTILGLPSRLALFVAATVVVAMPLVGLSLASIAVDPPTASTALAALVFFGLALAADLRPVPMDDSNKSEVSIASVFIVTAAILLGWRFAVPAAALSIGITFAVIRRPLPHTLFNISMYALSALAAALPVFLFGPIHGAPAGRLTGYVLFGGALHLAVNVVLVAGAISISQQVRYREVVVPGLRQGGAAFVITVVLTALAANLWVTEPWLLVLLAGPTFTLTLYQRSALNSRLATQAAMTDNLTGLGNHRAYQAALHDRIGDAERTSEPFSLCLLDVDDFKDVNDSYGHAAGDAVLVRLGELLGSAEQAEAFRFGGDEFAVIFSRDEIGAYRQLEEIQRQLVETDAFPGGPVTISAGIATFPSHAQDADALERETERSARLRAAKNLVRFVDARDPQTANHSELVSALAEGVGLQLGLDSETVDQLKLAGLLHDLGKVGLPDAVLKEARTLTEEEHVIVRRHPEFGHALLEGMELEQVQDWVLHHHEHWDGSGYPDGLAGEEIPLGSRIILVADAFVAITTDRPYRAAQSEAAALRELRAHAGSQFDPSVVEALERYLDQAPTHLEALA